MFTDSADVRPAFELGKHTQGVLMDLGNQGAELCGLTVSRLVNEVRGGNPVLVVAVEDAVKQVRERRGGDKEGVGIQVPNVSSKDI